jgi:site-specific recombinase XerD
LKFENIKRVEQDGKEVYGFLLIECKNKKQRMVYLPHSYNWLFEEYLQNREQAGTDNPHIFIAGANTKKEGVGISRVSVWNMCEEISGLSPHKFRSACASFLVNNYISLLEVSKYLGHTNTNTTAQFYTNLAEQRKIRTSEIFNGGKYGKNG